MTTIRIRRLAAELRMRRRRLDVYRRSPPWPGKDPAWGFELARYDQHLLLAAHMLEVPIPEHSPGRRLTAGVHAVLEDRLGLAGLDVVPPAARTTEVLEDGDVNP